MKVIIAGSRDIVDYDIVEKAVNLSNFKIDEVVCGGARGVDFLGQQWALNNKVPVSSFIAEWVQYGKAAGHIRNGKMANYADAAIVIIKNRSKGSLNMIENAKKRKLLLFVLEYNSNNDLVHFGSDIKSENSVLQFLK